jgi:cytosine/adenosine deaminase-related metal-dependent hydrolase
MTLNNVTAIGSAGPVNMHVSNGKMTAGKDPAIDTLQLTFDNALIFPGLINSHDHLDFNLFPQLGNRIYNNYTEWGGYIHQNYKDEIAAVLKVPLDLRLRWGMFKNLLCGVTTVVNHGEQVVVNDAPITVEQCHSIHSVQFEKAWRIKLNNPLKRKQPAVIHTGEGNDELAHNEIDSLIYWNLLKKKLIGVHGVAMSEDQAKEFEALVWCPVSNFFLLNQTAHIDFLKKHTAILFGTDSTLTGNWNLWDHIRLARKTHMLTDSELYDSLYLNPAAVWKTNNSNKAALIVANKKGSGSWLESFYLTDPEDLLLVVHDEHIRLFDESLLSQLGDTDLSQFSKIYIKGACKYVQGDLPELMKQIKEYYPEAIFPITVN